MICDEFAFLISQNEERHGRRFASMNRAVAFRPQLEHYIVPEPSSLTLATIGMLGFTRRVRRREQGSFGHDVVGRPEGLVRPG